MDRNIIKFKDESYGMININRGQIGGDGKKLFGSDIKHNNVISLSIKRGVYERELYKDWFFGEDELIRIDLSPVQFAEAITNINGMGVPCTITRYNGKGINEVPELDNKKEIFRKEFALDIKDMVDNISRLTEEVNELMNKKSITKADKLNIQEGLSQINRNLKSNIPFLVESFDEQLEKSVSSSKAEVEAYVQSKIQSLGMKELEKQFNGLLIDEK